MSPAEFYILWEARRPRDPSDYRGSLSEREAEELYQMLHQEG